MRFAARPEERLAEQWRPYLELGFSHLIADIPAPHDGETLQRLARVREALAGG